MAKYHLNEKGVAGVCRAKEGNCPLGGDKKHFESKEDAQKAYEKIMENQLHEAFTKTGPSWEDEQFKLKVARRRRVEDAILKSDPNKTVRTVPYERIETSYDGLEHSHYYVHPDFRAALPDDNDMAEYFLMVHKDHLSDSEKDSASVSYNEKKGILDFNYLSDDRRGEGLGSY